MTDLITHLSKLDAPDREADREIAQLFNMPWDYSAEWIKKRDEAGNRFDVPVAFPYTASVDAAIALAERLFPGTEYEFTNLYNIVRVTIELNGEFGGFHGEHLNSLPIAICIALLRAKEASK